jgi:serine/threonine protein kinase
MPSSLAAARLGPFVVRDPIGHGGIAEVYRAEHADGGQKQYALKIMRPERAAEKHHRKAFLDEFNTLRGLDHAGIPKVYRNGEIGGRPAFILDMVPGINLARVASQVSYPGVLCYAQLCEIVAYLHDKRIVHNDIKLENCLLRPDQRLVLVDFGNARPASSGGLLARLLNRTPKQVFGTATYLAPELIQGAAPTLKSDVYALGVCAFLMLSGKPPFVESRESGRLRAHLSQVPPSIVARVSGIHPSVASVIDACLEKDPAHRPADASEVHAMAKLHLEKLRETQVVRARAAAAALDPAIAGAVQAQQHR